jgi:hypothetical protein
MFKILDPPFLSAFSIIFEKLMKNRSTSFITKNNGFIEALSGFKGGSQLKEQYMIQEAIKRR